MSIGEILLGLLVGGGVGGGAFYFLQKGRVSEIAERYDQKYLQTRQALEAAETELDEKKTQLFALSQSEARTKTELQKLEANYQIQLEEKQASINVSSELERTKAQLLDYQSQIEAYQNQILELQQTYSNQLQEIESAHQAEFRQQQTYSTQLQEIEQAYQNQIVELEKTHQTQILELEQAHQSQIRELQEVNSDLASRSSLSERPDKIVQPSRFTEPWDEDFSKTTLIEMSFPEVEEIAEIASLEELVDLTSQTSDKPEEPPINASQTLIGDDESSQSSNPFSNQMVDVMDFLESLELEDQDDNSRFELEEPTSVKQDFSDFVLTPEEMKADLKDQFTSESNNPFELADESIDLDLFDSFEPPKYEDLGINEENLNKMHINGTNGVLKSELNVDPDTDIDFFKMLEEEHPETSESLDIDDKELNIEDLFHSEWESSSKN